MARQAYHRHARLETCSTGSIPGLVDVLAIRRSNEKLASALCEVDGKVGLIQGQGLIVRRFYPNKNSRGSHQLDRKAEWKQQGNCAAFEWGLPQ